jgi:sodium transport system ATP-binding protein
MTPTVQVSGLSKTFGTYQAVRDLSFEVRAGEVFGLLGPNGAGKTTTLRVLATLLRPSRGEARVAGFDIRRQAERVRAAIGVVNGGMGLYDRLTGREVLTYFGQLYGLNRAEIGARIEELDALLGLRGLLERRTGDLSTGMKQKIVIARAVLHDPPVIFFDEATSGLDVLARRSVLNFVKSYPKGARAVVYSTHVMSEVEELCDRVAILYEGRLIAQGTPRELTQAAGARGLESAFFTLVERSARARTPQVVQA